MTAVAVLLLASGVGRLALRAVRVSGQLPRLERFLFAVAAGLGILGYCVFAMGLSALLRPVPMLIGGAVLLIPAVPGWRLLVRDWRESDGTSTGPEEPCPRTSCRVSVLLWGLAGPAGVASLLACWVPQGAHEWDSLSYHLAVPATYLREGRLVELPTDHHSYFPFLTQMLYTVALLFGGVADAKLIHWSFGALSVMATYALGRRMAGRFAGTVAASAFSLTPMVIWEAGTAYIELAQTFYCLLAVGGLIAYYERRHASTALVSGAMAGFALAVKTLSLIPAAILTAAFLARKPSIRNVLAFAVGLVAFASPFYLRTYLLTGNPVYPFAFSVFGGKYWDAARAETYASEQRSYGLDGRVPAVGEDLRPLRRPHVPPSLADRIRNALMAPFALVNQPRLFHNYNDAGPLATLGFLCASLWVLALLHPGPASTHLRLVGVISAVWFAAWTLTMQYSRYLIPVLPLGAVVGAAGLVSLARVSRIPVGGFLLATIVQASILVTVLVPRAEEHLNIIRDPDARERFLAQQVNIYRSCVWLNEHAARTDGVVLFEETRGFYLRRPVLWGNSPHATYIPYESFRNAAEMIRWFTGHGWRYAIVNLRFAPQAAQPEGVRALRAAASDPAATRALFLSWYFDGDRYREPWRRLLAEAVAAGDAEFVAEASGQGTLVLRFRDGALDGE